MSTTAKVVVSDIRAAFIKANLGTLRNIDTVSVNVRDFHTLCKVPESYLLFLDKLKDKYSATQLVFANIPGNKLGKKAHFLKLECAKYLTSVIGTYEAQEVLQVLKSGNF